MQRFIVALVLNAAPLVSQAQEVPCLPAEKLAQTVGCYVGTDVVDGDKVERGLVVRIWLENGEHRSDYSITRIPEGMDQLTWRGHVVSSEPGQPIMHGSITLACVTSDTEARYDWFNDHKQIGTGTYRLGADGKSLESKWKAGKTSGAGSSQRVDAKACAALQTVDITVRNRAIELILQQKRTSP